MHARGSARVQAPDCGAPAGRSDFAAGSELRVPMQRLNSAMRRKSAVDSAIDLGIALESIFLRDTTDDRSELTFKLRVRSEEHTSELQSRLHLVCRLLLEKKK